MKKAMGVRFVVLLCVGGLFLFFFACNEHELPPYIANPETTAASTTTASTVPTGCSHEWNDWETELGVNCNYSLSTRRCTLCGKEENKLVKIEHDLVYEEVFPSTCDNNGQAWSYCVKCDSYEPCYVSLPTVPHQFVDKVCVMCGQPDTTDMVAVDTLGEWIRQHGEQLSDTEWVLTQKKEDRTYALSYRTEQPPCITYTMSLPLSDTDTILCTVEWEKRALINRYYYCLQRSGKTLQMLCEVNYIYTVTPDLTPYLDMYDAILVPNVEFTPCYLTTEEEQSVMQAYRNEAIVYLRDTLKTANIGLSLKDFGFVLYES